VNSVHREHPRTDDTPTLPDRFQRLLRVPALPLFKRRWDLRIHHAERVPADGPVILAPNHVGWLDGPLLVGTAPRPVHAMVKLEEFDGRFGPVMVANGQIPLDRFNVDMLAVKLAVRLLREGRVVAIYPEGARGEGDARYVKRGWAYLAMVTGATIVPVATFGTRLAGESIEVKPPAGRRIDVVYGEPVPVDAVPWPRRATDVRELTEHLQNVLSTHIAQSAQMCGAAATRAAPDGEGPEPGSIGITNHIHPDGGTAP
jgi:1-acyl-sn-glycerol-3-phosphate acyltransferase